MPVGWAWRSSPSAPCGLRLYLLDKQSLWYDEGVTAEIARRGLGELTRWTAGDIQPPLYYYVVALWGRLAGWSEWSLRFPSVFFGVLLVPLLAAVTIALTRRRLAGLLAASLAAFHPLLLYYSQEARMYAMLTALGVLLGYLVIHGETVIRRRTLHWLAYVLVATAAVYTHYFAFFLLLALALAYLVDQLFVLPRIKAQTDDAGQRRRPTVHAAPRAAAGLLCSPTWSSCCSICRGLPRSSARFRWTPATGRRAQGVGSPAPHRHQPHQRRNRAGSAGHATALGLWCAHRDLGRRPVAATHGPDRAPFSMRCCGWRCPSPRCCCWPPPSPSSTPATS